MFCYSKVKLALEELGDAVDHPNNRVRTCTHMAYSADTWYGLWCAINNQYSPYQTRLLLQFFDIGQNTKISVPMHSSSTYKLQLKMQIKTHSEVI